MVPNKSFVKITELIASLIYTIEDFYSFTIKFTIVKTCVSVTVLNQMCINVYNCLSFASKDASVQRKLRTDE